MKYLFHTLRDGETTVTLPWDDNRQLPVDLHEVQVRELFPKPEIAARGTIDLQDELERSYSKLQVALLSGVHIPEDLTRLVVVKGPPTVTPFHDLKAGQHNEGRYGWTVSAQVMFHGLKLSPNSPPLVGPVPEGFLRGKTFPWWPRQAHSLNALDIMPRDWEEETGWLRLFLKSYQVTFEYKG